MADSFNNFVTILFDDSLNTYGTMLSNDSLIQNDLKGRMIYFQANVTMFTDDYHSIL